MKEKIKISCGIGICILITFFIGVCFYILISNRNEVGINKTYSEIINSLDVNNFDKNKFSGEFLIKKVNNLISNEINYYNINGELVDEYVPETVLATWDDISNYESDLYKGLNLNKEIPYSSYMIYRNNLPNETIFYLEANKTEYSANETIKDAFNKNNVGLYWSTNSINTTSNTIHANEIISVSTELRKKWNDNELGIFIELLGEPSRIYKMPDISKDAFLTDIEKTEFDLIKDYYLFWEYDEYYIRMRINYMMDGKFEKNSFINQVIVKSKDSNSTTGDYKKEISWGEENAEKIFSINSNLKVR